MSEILVETAFKGIFKTLTILKELFVGNDNESIINLSKLLGDIEPIIKELEQNFINDESINKQIQNLSIVCVKINKFITKYKKRSKTERCFQNAVDSFKNIIGLNDTEEQEIKSFYLIVEEIKNNISHFLKYRKTKASLTLNKQMDEMLDRLKTNISTEDNKRLETILQEQEKQIDDLKRFIVEKDNKYISLLIDKDESYKEQIDLLREEILELSRMVLNLQEQLREHTIILSKHSSEIENLKSETRHKLDMVEMSKYESVLREKLDLEDLLKTLQKEKLDMVEMSNSKYESVLREKLELEDLLKTLQKEKMDLEETHKKLQTTHIQCKFDEEVFKNLERNYHTLTAKFTKIEMEYKELDTEHNLCKEQIVLKQNLNMVLLEEKLPEYIEEIPFGTHFVYSHINYFGSSFNVIKNINSCGYIHFMKDKIIFPIKDEYKSGDKKYISPDKKIHIYPNAFSLWDEHNRVIISHSYVCHGHSSDSKYFRVNHPALDYQTICNGEQTYIYNVLHMFMYPYSKVDTLDRKRIIFYETEYPKKDDTILKFINVRDKYRSIKIFYLLNLDVNIEFGYFYIIGEDTEVRISKCVDKNVYVEESDYPLCKFKAGEFIEFISDKTGLLEMRFDIPSKQLVFYENEKVVGMKMIKDTSYYFVKYY